MSSDMMQDLIDKIRREYSSLTNKKGEMESYVYIVKNQEFLIDVGRSTKNNDTALTGAVTDIKHAKSGIAMMASAYNRARNNIYYIPTTKRKGAEIEKELKQIEKKIKGIVLSHYDISDKNGGATYCSGTTKDKDVSSLLKGFLYEGLSQETLKELNEPVFSFTELLEMVNEDGTAWHNIMSTQKSSKLACKLLGVQLRS
jgi:hypothetical protein